MSDETDQVMATVSYTKPDGGNGFFEVSLADLRNRLRIVPALLERGVLILNERKTENRLVTRLFREAANILNNPKQVGLFTRKVGWTTDGAAFVLPTGVIPKTAQIRYVGASTDIQNLGSSKTWRQDVAQNAQHSTRMVLGICVGLAAPLLRFFPIQVQNFGINFYGSSEIGQTIVKVAQSVWGRPRLVALDRNGTGLDEMALEHRDCLLPLGQARDGSMREICHYLSRGRTNPRNTGYRHVPQPKQAGEFRVAWLCAHETAYGFGQTPGPETRLIDVSVGSSPTEIFDMRPSGLRQREVQAWGDDMMREIDRGIENHCGHACRRFLARLQRELAKPGFLAEVQRQFTDIVASFDGSDGGRARQLAQLFALCVIAGRLAIKWRILPWDPEALQTAVDNCLQDALATSPEAEEKRNLARDICRWIYESDFTTWTGTIKKENTIYYQPRIEECPGLYLVRKNTLNHRFGNNRLVTETLKYILENGGLIREKGRDVMTIQRWYQGVEDRRRLSFYAFAAKFVRRCAREDEPPGRPG